MFERAGEVIDRLLAELARHAFLHDLVMSTLVGLGVYLGCALVVIVAELSQRQSMAAYRTRSSLNDLAYVIFYQCSIYSVLVMPLFAFLSPRLQFLRVDLLSRLPPVISLVIWWITFDFLNYWVHRLQHTVRPLWAFHSVHHAPKQLTFLTANRIHAVEQLYVSVLIMVPAFILGIQPRWLPILFVQILIETLQHARLSWTFGPMHRMLVSPAFHAVHHSTDAREYNGNYARLFSLWDVLFGTFVRSEQPARRFGVEGMDVPERLTAQFLHPFRVLRSAD